MVDRLLKKELDSIFTFSKVKLYFDQDHLCEGYFFDLFVSIHSEKIQLADEGEKYFELVNSVEEADFIFIPIPLSDLLGRAGGRKCIQYHDSLASTFQKTLVMVSDADLLFDPGVENYLLLTPGPYKSMKQQMAIPALLQQDPLKKWFNGQWKPVSKQKEISVGFCGQATSNFLKNIKDHLQYFWLNGEKLLGKSKHLYIPFFLAAKERADLLDTLEQSSVIKTDFLKRERYKGGAKSDEDQKRLEFEFFKNIYDNLFTVCMRGFGNYSVRFFQTLAMGRIPVVIDTDTVLPFENIITYERICIRIPYKDRFKADAYIADFFKGKSEEELNMIQKDCRQIWESYFNKEGMFLGLATEFKNILKIRDE